MKAIIWNAQTAVLTLLVMAGQWATKVLFSELGALETIAEANKYSTTELMRGVVEEIVDDNPMFAMLPVKTILGNSLTYNRESTLPTSQFHNPGDTWTEDTPVITPVTAVLKIAGHDSDVDNFLKRTRSDKQDLEAESLAASAKSVGRLVANEVVYGDVDDIDPKGFDGMHEILGVVTGAQDVVAGTTTSGGAGSFSELDQVIDLVKPFANALVMSRRSLRQIRKLARAQGDSLQSVSVGGAAINVPVNSYNNLPIFINDFITDLEDVEDGGFAGKSGDDTSSIFAIHLGEAGLHLLDSGPGIEIEDVGLLEQKDATRKRIKWYIALALMSTLALGRYSGIDTQDWTN